METPEMTVTERARAEGRCFNCWEVAPTECDPHRAGTIFGLLCAQCRQRVALDNLQRQAQAAAIHARLLGLVMGGLTVADLVGAAKAGEDLFGVRALTATEARAFMLAAEDACYFYPAGHPMRETLGWVRGTCHKVRTDWQRRQKRFEAARRKLAAFTTPAPDAATQYAEAA